MGSLAMTDDSPRMPDDPMYWLLREGKVEEFNRRRAAGEKCDLTRCNLRGVDLRGLDASGLDLTGCYFRQADLRGVNLTRAKLEGASLHAAHISGTYFPKELSADEIELSLRIGVRLRYR
jgi:uncharacterized protein YjbI with pentapeptide repeats